jgi:hypothetical protein
MNCILNAQNVQLLFRIGMNTNFRNVDFSSVLLEIRTIVQLTVMATGIHGTRGVQ